MTKIKNKALCRKEFHERSELFQKLLEVAKGDIVELLNQNNIDTISTLGRVKKFDSYYSKALNGMMKGTIPDPINQIQDIVGIRSILIFMDDLEKISTLLTPTFKIIENERKGQNIPENAFGYESDHYILQYNEVIGPRYEGLMELQFELQVRTPLMDAWASLSHKIDYKTDAAIPTNMRKVFFGLSGMFAVADKVFQDLKNSSEENKRIIFEKNNTINELFGQEINLDTLKRYLFLKFPEKYNREAGEMNTDVEYSELIAEMKSVGGYDVISDIDEAVESTLSLELDFEKVDIDTGKLVEGGRRLVGTMRGVLDLFDDRFRKMRFAGFEGTELFAEIEIQASSVKNKKIRKDQSYNACNS